MAKGTRKSRKGGGKQNGYGSGRSNNKSVLSPLSRPLLTVLVCCCLVVAAVIIRDKAADSEFVVDYDREVPPPKLVSEHPRIYFIEGVLSDSECEALVQQAKQGSRVQSTSGKNKDSQKWRTSITASLRKDVQGSTPVVDALVKRVAKAANVSETVVRSGNPLQVTQYQHGGRYLPHTDSRPLESLDKVPSERTYGVLNNYKVNGGYPYTARYMTALCYLNDDYEGGATVFPLAHKDGSYKERPSVRDLRAMQNDQHPANFDNWAKTLPSMCEGTATEGISINPDKGSCVFFYNHLEEDGGPGALDGLALHAGCDVRNGNKWITNVWIESIPKRKNSDGDEL